MMMMMHLLQLQLSPPLLLSLVPKIQNETFWYRLTQVHLEKWSLKQRRRYIYFIVGTLSLAYNL